MKTNKKSCTFFSLILLFGWILTSCMSEEPFKSEGEGDVLVRLNVSMNSKTTRAVTDEDLYSNCHLYVSNNEGLLFKWNGISEIPTNGVYLKYGSYLAEGWAGDSVAASFDKRYFKGETRFDVNESLSSTSVNVICKIANVVVSVDVSDLDPKVTATVKLDVKSSTGALSFSGDTLDMKGYFMRNYDNATESYDDELTYTLTGEDIDGTPISRTGTIANVLPAHEYCITLQNDTPDFTIGGAAIQIQVKEFEIIVDDTVIIHGQPQFAWLNNELDITRQLYNSSKTFEDHTLFIAAYEEFESLILSTENPELKEKLGFERIDLVGSSASVKERLADEGFIIEYLQMSSYKQYRVTLTSQWLNSLPTLETEYVISVTAMDKRGMSSDMKVRIANTETALDTPFILDEAYWKSNLLSIRAHKAEISATILDKVDNLSIMYRETTGEWQTKELGSVEAGKHIIELNDLKDGTSYEVKIVGGEQREGEYQFETLPSTFKTEEEFVIPNASMDNWWLYNKKIWMPNAQNAAEFWDTGNHGSTTIGDENDNLTTQFTEFYHENGSSTSCARLQSKFVGFLGIGKLGSGNIFTGKYAGTSGTNGKIDFGREYNASHPSKVRVWVNYRPQPGVKNKGADSKYIAEGAMDQGQIYIALTDQIKSVNTGDQSTLVTAERAPSLFLAYGEKTFTEDFGGDRELAEVEIDFTYYDRAKTVAPKYMIIVCCASKYGDYFSGGEGSTMYVDDFEFVYE